MDENAEIELFNNDNFADDEVLANSGGIYGIDIPGSCGTVISPLELQHPKLFAFIFHHGVLALDILIEKLINQYKLNFISMVTNKVKPNAKVVFALIHYDAKISRFMASIKEGNRNVVTINGIRTTVKVLKQFKFSLVGFDEALKHHRNTVNNLYFKYVPLNNRSPSQNLYGILLDQKRNTSLSTLIKGVVLKINYDIGVLYQYGNLILSGMITAKSLDDIRQILPTANMAIVSAYILPHCMINDLRTTSQSPLKVTERMLSHNVLVNCNTETDSALFHSRTPTDLPGSSNERNLPNIQNSNDVCERLLDLMLEVFAGGNNQRSNGNNRGYRHMNSTQKRNNKY